MKKIIAALLCAMLILSFAACSEEQTPVTTYDELVTKLSATVSDLFSEGFEASLSEGEYKSPTGELDDKWSLMLSDAKADFHNIDKNAFGYKLVDLNSDSISELLFLRSDNRVLAVFTINEGKPLLLDAYNRNYQCIVMDTGELYTLKVREDGGYDHKISTLNPSSHTLVTTVSFGTEGGICYEMIGGEIYTTSSDRITELTEQYPFEMSKILDEIELNLF